MVMTISGVVNGAAAGPPGSWAIRIYLLSLPASEPGNIPRRTEGFTVATRVP
jgi:hypothetical protein